MKSTLVIFLHVLCIAFVFVSAEVVTANALVRTLCPDLPFPAAFVPLQSSVANEAIPANDEDTPNSCHCRIGRDSFHIEIQCENRRFINKQFEAEILPVFTEILDMSWNNFEFVPDFVGEDLRMLDMSHNRITSIDDKNFARLPSLEELNLSWNKIEALSVNAFSGLDKLVKLDLSRNMLRKITVGVFAPLPRLNQLNLSRNRHLNETFNQPDVDLFLTLGVTTKLRILEIEECDLDFIDIILGVRLQTLHLKYNNFSAVPDIPREIERLDLSGNPITKLNSTFLPHLKNLQEIYMMDMPNLTVVDEYSLFGLRRLKTINFEGSWKLSDFHCDAFGSNDNLNETGSSVEVLNLRGTNFRTLNSSYVLTNLKVLDLAGTPLVCDCDIKWLVELELETNAECTAPSVLRGRRISNLTIDELKCKRWSDWVYKTLNGLLVLLLLVMCGVATWLIVTGIRPSRVGQLQKVGAASPYARVTIEPNRAEHQ